MDLVMDSIREDYFEALKGREDWLRLKDEYGLESEDCLILCVVENPNWIREVIKWLPEFIKRKQFSKTIFLSTTELPVIPKADEFFLKCIATEKDIVGRLLKYYRLTQFTRYIYAISLEPPFGNDFMIGHKGITIQDWLRNFG